MNSASGVQRSMTTRQSPPSRGGALRFGDKSVKAEGVRDAVWYQFESFLKTRSIAACCSLPMSTVQRSL